MQIKTLVAVCIASVRGEEYLRPLLQGIFNQKLSTQEITDIRIFICNNDPSQSLINFIGETKKNAVFPVTFLEEPQRGITFARQKLVDATQNYDAIIFIDDDEVPSEGWLQALLDMWNQYSRKGIFTGPVKAIIPPSAPWWVKRSKTFDSWRVYKTGQKISKAYTNNILISSEVIKAVVPAFSHDFSLTGSEDVYFSMRAYQAGFDIVWCQEALVFSYISPSRLQLKWLGSRSFQEGRGDAKSRLCAFSGFFVRFRILFLSQARMISGIFLLLFGFLALRMRYLVKGYRRICAAAGTFVGMFA